MKCFSWLIAIIVPCARVKSHFQFYKRTAFGDHDRVLDIPWSHSFQKSPACQAKSITSTAHVPDYNLCRTGIILLLSLEMAQVLITLINLFERLRIRGLAIGYEFTSAGSETTEITLSTKKSSRPQWMHQKFTNL